MNETLKPLHREVQTVTDADYELNDGDFGYLAGYFDSAGSLALTVKRADNYRLNYKLKFSVRVRIPSDHELVYGRFADYCERTMVKFWVSEEENTNIVEVTDEEDAARFLEPLLPHLVIRYDDARLALDEIIPRLRKDRDLEADGFVELLRVGEPLRRKNRRGKGISADELAEEWNLEGVDA